MKKGEMASEARLAGLELSVSILFREYAREVERRGAGPASEWLDQIEDEMQGVAYNATLAGEPAPADIIAEGRYVLGRIIQTARDGLRGTQPSTGPRLRLVYSETDKPSPS